LFFRIRMTFLERNWLPLSEWQIVPAGDRSAIALRSADAGPDPERLLTSAAIGLMPLWTRRHLHLPWLPIAEQTVVRGMGAAAVGTIRWAMTPTTD
jgi:hypothetical protein